MSKSTWWRWPLVPIAGFAGGAIGSALFALLQLFSLKLTGDLHEDGWMLMYVTPTISSAVFGYLFVTITHYVAPSGKFISSVVMTTVLGLFLLLSGLVAWASIGESTSESIKTIVACIVALIASISTLASIAKQDGTIA